MLDKAFVLSAQAFVALLPIVIVLISAVFQSDGVGLAISLSDRFGLEGAARDAVVGLFNAPEHTMALSWLAIAMSLLSAWSLGRRLATTYATIFDLPPLPRKQMWRALVWVVVMALLIVSTSQLRDVARAYGVWALILGSLGRHLHAPGADQSGGAIWPYWCHIRPVHLRFSRSYVDSYRAPYGQRVAPTGSGAVGPVISRL